MDKYDRALAVFLLLVGAGNAAVLIRLYHLGIPVNTTKVAIHLFFVGMSVCALVALWLDRDLRGDR
jgi:hypothetical protein